MRPLTMRSITRLYVAGAILGVQSSAAAFALSVVKGERVAHPWALRLLALLLLAVALFIAIALVAVPAARFRRLTALTGLTIIFSMGLASTVGLWASGPNFGLAAVFYFEALPLAFYTLRMRWALLAAANAVGGCALVMFVQPGWIAPAVLWLIVATTVVAVAWHLGFLAERAESLAASEHEARRGAGRPEPHIWRTGWPPR